MIQIIDTGVANIRSLQASFDRLGQPWKLTVDPEEIRSGTHVVLPGVGAFAAAARKLDEFNLREPLIQRIEADRATLCICLGMQLLCAGSDESPDTKGLAIISQHVSRFGVDVQIPQLGWNEVTPQQPNGPFELGLAYFANSFRLVEPPDDWGFAETEYGGVFISSIWRGRILACQFHPELSAAWGQTLLEDWINMS